MRARYKEAKENKIHALPHRVPEATTLSFSGPSFVEKWITFFQAGADSNGLG
jgi:hypothetical protein